MGLARPGRAIQRKPWVARRMASRRFSARVSRTAASGPGSARAKRRTVLRNAASACGAQSAGVLAQAHVPAPVQLVASRPEEFHLRPLTERCGSLSAHTAPTKQACRHPRRPVSEETRVALPNVLDEAAGSGFVPFQAFVLPHGPSDQSPVEG